MILQHNRLTQIIDTFLFYIKTKPTKVQINRKKNYKKMYIKT